MEETVKREGHAIGGLWYDAYWQASYDRALNFLAKAYPKDAEAFVEALASFPVPHSFEARQLRAFFDAERIAEMRDVISGLPKAELEAHELLPYGRLVLHDHPYFTDLQAQLVERVGEGVGEAVEASYNFLSLYNNLGVCDLHMDAPSAKWTLDVCIDQSDVWPLHLSRVQPWPFRLDGLSVDWRKSVLAGERFSSHVLEPGDALLFGGSAQWHYRERIPRRSANNFCHLIFFHFIPVGTLFEMLRNTVSSADEMERQLDVPHMGTLPLIRTGSAKGVSTGPLTEYRDNPDSYFSECIRSLRTALMLRHGGRGVSRLVVTSTDADEGKSSVALNLALSFAQMRRTLIVDCDLRRPSLERALIPDRRHPIGLTDVLAGAAEIDACLVETDDPGLSLLPSGSRTLNPLEVLSAPSFAMLLNTLGEQFDIVIFDTPPCLVVSDAYVVATQADEVVFIVKAGVSKVASARAALRRLRGLNADLVGAVLNQFDLSSSRYVPGLAGYDSYRKYSERPAVDVPLEAEPAKTA